LGGIPLEELQIQIRKVGGAAVVKFSGNFDYDLDHVNEELVEKQLSGQSNSLVLDMANVKKMASAFINRLVKILRIVDKDKGRLYLINVSEQAVKVLSMVNIIGRFSIIRSEDELLALQNETTAKSDAKLAASLSLSRKSNGGIHTVHVVGSVVEGTNTASLLDEVKAALSEGATSVNLDFSKVDLLDTISVGILLMVQKMCEEKKVPVKIENLNEVTAHVLQMNEVGRLFGLQ
jgi:anti-anti-sigma factor